MKAHNSIRSGVALAATMLALGSAATATAQSAPAVQRTPEGAHRFLQQVLTNGNAFFNTVSEHGFNQDWALITRYSGSACYSIIYAEGNDGEQKFRRFDWSKVTSVSSYQGGLFMGDSYPVVDVVGPVTISDGDVVGYVRFQVDGALMNRIGEAAEFLRNHCDKTGGTGF